MTAPVLHSKEDWYDWYPYAKTVAIDLEVWQYIDPMNKGKLPEPPKTPKEPVLADFHTQASTPDVQFKQLDENDRAVYQQAQSDYRWQYKMYEKAHRGMVEYRKFLSQTVNAFYLGPNGEESLPGTMRRLQRLFWSAQMGEDLRKELEQINQRPQSSSEADAKWIFDWLTVARRVVQHVVEDPAAIKATLRSLFEKWNPGFLQDSLRNDEEESMTYEELALMYYQKAVADEALAVSKGSNAQEGELTQEENTKITNNYTTPNGHSSEYERNGVERKEIDVEDIPIPDVEMPSAANANPTPFKNCWILATGTNVHICNDRSRFIDLDTSTTDLKVGKDQTVQAQGYGQAWIQTRNHKRKPTRLVLSNVAYVPDFHTNMVSVALLEERNIYYNGLLKQLVNVKNECVAAFDMRLGKPILECHPYKPPADPVDADNSDTQTIPDSSRWEEASTTAANYPGSPRPCLCGVMHRFWQCPYLNKTQRDEDWVENKGIRKRINKAIARSPFLADKIKLSVERSIQYFEKQDRKRQKNSSGSTKDPSPDWTFEHETEQTDSWGGNSWGGNDGAATIETWGGNDGAATIETWGGNDRAATTERAPAERAPTPTVDDKGEPEPQAAESCPTNVEGQQEEEQQASETPDEMTGRTSDASQPHRYIGDFSSLAGAGKKLLNSWVIIATSEIHICNDRSRFDDFISSPESVLVDGAPMKIEGYGKARVNVWDALGKRKKLYLHGVAYIPEFTTNVVSSSALAEDQISYDLFMDQLTGQDCRCIAQVQSMSGFSVLEYNPADDTQPAKEDADTDNHVSSQTNGEPDASKQQSTPSGEAQHQVAAAENGANEHAGSNDSNSNKVDAEKRPPRAPKNPKNARSKRAPRARAATKPPAESQGWDDSTWSTGESFQYYPGDSRPTVLNSQGWDDSTADSWTDENGKKHKVSNIAW